MLSPQARLNSNKQISGLDCSALDLDIRLSFDD